MNTYYTLWLSSLDKEMASLGGKTFKRKFWGGTEEGFMFSAPDGPVKLVVVPPEKVQKGHLMARSMRVELHYPAGRRIRPLSLCYGEPRCSDDAKGAVLNLLSDVRQALKPQPVLS